MRDRLRKVRAISFDGDMTLWDFRKVMRRALGHALGEIQARLPCEASAGLTVDRMVEIRDTVAGEFGAEVVNHEEIRLRAFRRTLEYIGVRDDDFAAQLNALYLERRYADIEFYPDALPALDALRAHYRLGLITNGNTYPERYGIQDRFSFAVFAQDIGVRKPDPAIFRVACREAGCEPDELMHVGDSLETDVAGAGRAGAISVWLNRSHEDVRGGVVPDITIHTLTELGHILQVGSGPPPGIP